MGYQESYYHVESLAQAAGIRQALRKWGKEAGVFYFCVERAKEPVFVGNGIASHIQAPPAGMSANYPAGSLFVVMGGDRSPYQSSDPRTCYIDQVFGLSLGDYQDHFEEVEEAKVDAALSKHPEGAADAYFVETRAIADSLAGKPEPAPIC